MKYQKIASLIINQIESDNMNQGDKLPSIDELMAIHNVGKNTIIKAIDLLESAGIVYQVRGSGIYVRGHRRKGYINLLELQGFKSMLREFKLDSKILTLRVEKPSKDVRDNLNIGADEDVYYVERLRFIEGQPLFIEKSYYKKSLVPYLNEDIATTSIFQYVTKDLQLDIGFVDSFFRVVKLNEREAHLLQLENGDPGLIVESIFHLKNAETFNYSKILYHYNEAQFFVQGSSYYSILQ